MVRQAVRSPPHPSWLPQNQTVKCTVLLSINREATLTKKYSGRRKPGPGKTNDNLKKKKKIGKERDRKRNGKRTEGD